MADIAQITLPSGTTYNIKDAWARTQIEAITGGSAVTFIGVSSTAITDGGTETPTISGWSDTVSTGNIVIYGKKEFIWGTDDKWHEMGDMSELGDLAYKDAATGSYTPAGSVSAPTISVSSAGSTTSINNPTKVTVAKTVTAAAPGATAPSNSITYYSVSGEVLSLYQIGYTTGDSITTTSTTVKTGDASYSASTPSFTGTAATITVD